jgi:hypothetical protein
MTRLNGKDVVSEKKETAYGNFVISQIIYIQQKIIKPTQISILHQKPKACDTLYVRMRKFIEQNSIDKQLLIKQSYGKAVCITYV